VYLFLTLVYVFPKANIPRVELPAADPPYPAALDAVAAPLVSQA
jgi:hypothetical protein